MRETRVNLKHLLEDIRDSYTIPLEEIILVELIANALDSGASCISFLTNPLKNTLTVIDNGKGMRRDVLVEYHNIAATAKIRGKGIGFAGVGAKLSLLVANSVLTETKGGYGSQCATEWYLKNEISAPWKFIPFSGKVPYSKGTAVSINFSNSQSPLLAEEFIIKTASYHFFPLFYHQPFQPILRYIYKKGVEFLVNNKKIVFSESLSSESKIFQLRVGGARQRLAGSGYLTKGENSENTFVHGLGISTYGKVTKSGWEWIGIGPKEDLLIHGIIEIPALAEILTTNKMDFLKDAASLKKYYYYRKAIQETILPILKEFGEEPDSSNQKNQFRSLTQDIERTVRNVLGDFPELAPLLGFKKTNKRNSGFEINNQAPLVGFIENNKKEVGSNEEQTKEGTENSSDPLQKSSNNLSFDVKKNKIKREPSLGIGFENRGEKEALARMVENKIWINTSHPAYFRAQQEKQEPYHIVFSVAWALSNFLEDNRSPQNFINDFLAFWGKEQKRSSSLLRI